MTQQSIYRPREYDQGFERSGGPRTAVIAIAVAYIVIQWLLALAAVQAYQDVSASGASGMAPELITYNILSPFLTIAAIAAYLLTGFWLQRARRNADRIAPDQQRRSRVWVWLGWITPIVFFWYPKQVVDDLWRSTVRTSGEPMTGWWWGTWLAAIAVSWVRLDLTIIEDGPSIGWVVSCVIVAMMMTVAGMFWIRVVRTVSDAQDALAGPDVAPSY